MIYIVLCVASESEPK